MSKSFYVNEENIKNGIITLLGQEFLHLKVQRKVVNDIVNIFNNTGKVFECEIEEINKNFAKVKILNVKESNRELNNELCLCFALSKADKMEMVMQKCTELGITKFIPFSSEFTVVKNNTTRIDRLEKIALEACKQCGGAKMPEILPIVSIKDLPKLLNKFDKTLLAYENANEKFNQNLQDKSVAIIVGSEGGFSKNEVEFLKENISNLSVVSLGRRILRAETACIALTTLALNYMGEI